MQVTKRMEEKKVSRLKKLLKEYYFGLTDSARGFETDVFEIIVWFTYRREIGKDVALLPEEDRLEVLEADKIAKNLLKKRETLKQA